MIDYLCLRLGWTTDQVLDNADFDNMRKLRLYVAMDDEERARLLPAIPLGFEKTITQQVVTRSEKATRAIEELRNGDSDSRVKPEEKLIAEFGGLDRVKKFFEHMGSGKKPARQLPIRNNESLVDRFAASFK